MSKSANSQCSLILGGARSGKSAWAEKQARASGLEVVVIATAQAGDAEMAERIALHRQHRPAHWITVEEPLCLADAIRSASRPERIVLVDCLTLWLSNLLGLAGPAPDPWSDAVTPLALPPELVQQRAALLATLPQMPGQVILVANEVGLGVVPLGALTRSFVDEAGRTNQAVAEICSQVVLMVAGLPLALKNSSS